MARFFPAAVCLLPEFQAESLQDWLQRLNFLQLSKSNSHIFRRNIANCLAGAFDIWVFFFFRHLKTSIFIMDNKYCQLLFYFFKIFYYWSILALQCCVKFLLHKSVNQLSVQFSHSVMSDSLWPHGLQHTWPPCPSPITGVYSNSCPLSQWCHPTISSSLVPFSSHLQSFPASGSFPISQLFASGGQSIGVSASTSVLLMNIKDWSPLGLTGSISLQSKGLSRVFSNTTVQKP